MKVILYKVRLEEATSYVQLRLFIPDLKIKVGLRRPSVRGQLLSVDFLFHNESMDEDAVNVVEVDIPESVVNSYVELGKSMVEMERKFNESTRGLIALVGKEREKLGR